MDLFDDTILAIKGWFDNKKLYGQSRSYWLPTKEDDSIGLALLEKNCSGRIVLKEDTRVELGHPSQGSSSAALVTHQSELVEDGAIILVGPEISENKQPLLPFAQIIIAAVKNEIGSTLEVTLELEKIASAMDRAAQHFGPVEGYMVRSIPNLIWARVSQEAFRSGFSLRQLGERLIWGMKRKFCEITACQVFFVTSSKTDVENLDELVEKARLIQKKLKSYQITSDGTLECTQDGSCNTCSEQTVCDTIRDVIRIRKGDWLVTVEENEIMGTGPE
jgi:CO dehydrogenase/acetyl-CoA synthase beta subunit